MSDLPDYLAPDRGYDPGDRYADFKAVFSGDRGERVLREILGWTHIYKAAARGSPIDPMAMSFAEGERNVGLRLLHALNHEPKSRPEKASNETR